MNNRKRNIAAARRKAKYNERQVLHKILDLVLDINGLESRTQEETGCLPTAFFEFHGHAAITSVWVYSNGWGPDNSPDYAEYFTDKRGLDNVLKTLDVLAHELSGGDSHVHGNLPRKRDRG